MNKGRKMFGDIKMFNETIVIPLEIIKNLGWENNDTILRLTIEDNEFLVIGKVKTHDEVIESINAYNPDDKIIQDTLRILIGDIERLDKRLQELEDRH